MPGAGDLDRRIAIERVTVGRDAMGGSTEVWANLMTVWARREDALDSERFDADEVAATRRTRWIIRSSSAALGVTPKDRITDSGGAVYEIDGIRETREGRHRFLELSTAVRIDGG